MKKIVILGGGAAGTMLANKLVKTAQNEELSIKVIDHSDVHYYQPGFLFIPFGIYSRNMVVKPRRDYIPGGVEFILSRVEKIEPDTNRVILENNVKVDYDILVIATGTRIVPEEVEGLAGPGWKKNIFDFYTPEGAVGLAHFLRYWKGGKLVLNIAEMPIKCPVAPLEFIFLADWWFTTQGMRDKVELVLATPLSGAFTRPIASKYLGEIVEQKNIKIVPDFNIESVDPEKNVIKCYEGRELDYDLLVEIPTNMGAPVIENSGIGDELHFVPTEKHTLRSKNFKNIFAMGDATDLPSSKAGSVAHFQVEILAANIIRSLDEKELLAEFDGHANCFIESGFGKGILIDFNYDTEPLPGKFPVPGVGPFSLLQETKMNHWGKMTFRWVYWNLLMRGAELPLEPQMCMKGKWAV
ncbi:MAG: NAD(P)/FAD-dependent oxidoreductase [bacterium]|nr:NAD(P)/FAD-dependent oxidoreductase [bacterium]